MSLLKSKWSQLFPDRLYQAYAMANVIHVAEDVNVNVIKIFTFLAAVALFLSIAGLYSSVSLNLVRRMKEVGVRKVFGASIVQIIWSTNIQFLVILLVSSAIGCIVGSKLVFFTMDMIWTYFQPANVVTFIICGIMVIGLACMMIGAKVYQAATANPIIALRDE